MNYILGTVIDLDLWSNFLRPVHPFKLFRKTFCVSRMQKNLIFSLGLLWTQLDQMTYGRKVRNLKYNIFNRIRGNLSMILCHAINHKMKNSKGSLLLSKEIGFSRILFSHASTSQKIELTHQPFCCMLEQNHRNFNQNTKKSNFLIVKAIIDQNRIQWYFRYSFSVNQDMIFSLFRLKFFHLRIDAMINIGDKILTYDQCSQMRTGAKNSTKSFMITESHWAMLNCAMMNKQ